MPHNETIGQKQKGLISPWQQMIRRRSKHLLGRRRTKGRPAQPPNGTRKFELLNSEHEETRHGAKVTFGCRIAGAIRFSTQDGILRFDDGERLRFLGIALKGRSSGIRTSLGKLCVFLEMERRRDEIERRLIAFREQGRPGRADFNSR